MSASLSVMAAKLEAAVPARNGVPGDYEELVKQAIWQLSVDVPMVKQVAINVVAATASYDLPADFLSLVFLAIPSAYNNVLISANGKLLPVGEDYQEFVMTDGGVLTIDPVPLYTTTRVLRYTAAHVLDATGNYPKLTGNGERVALLYAQYLALQEQATALSAEGWRYRIGDEEVDKSRASGNLQAQADSALKAYQNAVAGPKGYGSQYRHIRAVEGEVII